MPVLLLPMLTVCQVGLRGLKRGTDWSQGRCCQRQSWALTPGLLTPIVSLLVHWLAYPEFSHPLCLQLSFSLRSFPSFIM